MHSIAVAGHICADLTPGLGPLLRTDPGELFEVGPLRFALGGCVANTARVLAALGVDAHAYATVGSDVLGDFVRTRLEQEGIIARLRVDPAAATSYSIVLESPGRDRTFWHHPGANAKFDGSDIEPTTVDLFHLGYPTLLPGLLADDAAPFVQILDGVRLAGATASVDLAVVDRDAPVGQLDWACILRRIAQETDILSPSLDDLTSALGLEPSHDVALAEHLAGQLIEWGAAVAVVSLGADGLVLRCGSAERLRRAGRALAPLAEVWAGARLRVLALPVSQPHTTVGTGDAATAGLLYAIAAGADPQEALDLATACSAAVIEGLRPTPAAVTALQPALSGPFGQHARLAPIELDANQPPDRFYLGGDQIAAFRGGSPATPYTPEDWVGSTVTVRGEQTDGLTTLPDGRLLLDAINADPIAWLGPAHVARWGADPKLLVKLLDAGQRLPVHAHPDDAFAAGKLGTAHGKAEAWYMLSAGTVYLGLQRDVAWDELRTLVIEQRTDDLLGLMHEIAVQPGDRVFVPAGTLHAIGEGILLTEVQQPEDLSILLEWSGFAIDGTVHGHLGLGFDVALAAVDHRGSDRAAVERLIARADSPGNGLVPEADKFFRLERLDVVGQTPILPGFAILIGITGEAHLATDGGDATLARGHTVLRPAASGASTLRGNGTVLVARPPLP